MSAEITHYVYILRCKDGNLYTGWTTDPEKRVETHNLGKGAKYTKGRIPVTLVYLEAFSDKGDALRREAAIKKLTKEKKLELIGPRELGYTCIIGATEGYAKGES